MSIDDNNYLLLGVPPNATSKELRQAYLQLLVTAHPDKGGSSEGFAAIQKAYATLSDPAERAIYDEQLERKNKNRAPSSSHSHASTSHSVTTSKNGVTAYVHGQIHFPPQRPDHHKLRPAGGGAAVFAGQPTSQSDSSVGSISEKIRQLKKNRNDDKSSSAPEELREKQKALAELFAQRAALHFFAGRAHHATFDVEEALRIWPGCTEAMDVLVKLKESSLEDKNTATLPPIL